MRGKNLFILFVAFLIVVGAILYDQFNAKNEQSHETQTATPTSQYLSPTIPQTSLWLEPNRAKVASDGMVDLDMYINTQENKVTAVQLEISYDPTVLKFVSIQTTDLLEGKQILMKNIDEVHGHITFAAGISPSGQDISIQGADEIGKLVFQKLKTDMTQTEVTFLPSTLVTARNIQRSVLIGSKGAVINLSQ